MEAERMRTILKGKFRTMSQDAGEFSLLYLRNRSRLPYQESNLMVKKIGGSPFGALLDGFFSVQSFSGIVYADGVNSGGPT
ncbi:hypothetical protein F2Q69_00060965 [Brassica cretica]|uniref:Uncharacterized protein n=1 Tax=Brassica cretica TaxID=69181 RepID=A0A8S9RAV8_BRACR|nr:hypothetical protein F2Q69_00060965 [Brassica cretica]